MKRTVWAVLAAAGLATGAFAADPPKPAVEVRMIPAVDFAPLIEYGGGLFGQAEAGKQFADVVKLLANNPDQSMGFDLSKPLGVYLVLADKVEDSTVVLMVPITDEDTVVGTLKDKFNLDPKKDEKTGVYGMDVPNFPEKVFLRVADGYAYLTLKSAGGVDKDKLIAPKAFFGEKTDGVLAAKVHFDRIPADLRKAVWGQLELQLKEQAAAAPDAANKKLGEFAAETLTDAVKTLLSDGDALSLTLDVDPKADDLKLSLGVTPKKDTTLAKTLALWADRDSVAATAAGKNPLFTAGTNFALPPETAKKFAALVDGLAKDMIDNAKEDERPVAKMVTDAVLPSLRAGDFQTAVAMADAGGGKLTLTAAAKAVKGKEVGKVMSTLMPLMLPKDKGEFTADADKVGERAVHKFKSAGSDVAPFASDTIWVLTSDDLVAVGFDAKADGVKAVGAAKPAKAPMLNLEMSWVGMTRTTGSADADTVKNVANSVFDGGKTDGLDTMKLTARGGKQLSVDVTLKGKAFAFLAALGNAK